MTISRWLWVRLTSFSLLALVAGVPAPLRADPFTPGNLVVLTVGDASLNVGTSSATAVSLREYTTGGAFVAGSLVTLDSATPFNRLTQSGSAPTEGALSLSADGHYLTLVGYNAARGAANVANSNSDFLTGVARVVGLVDANGAVDVSTLSSGYDNRNIRSAATVDGNLLYTGGPGPNASNGLLMIAHGQAGGSGTSAAQIDTRVVQVFNNQLYGSTQTTIFQTVRPLPTPATGFTLTRDLVTGISNAMGFVFLDQDNNGTPDTLYVANQSGTGSLQKYSSTDGLNWTARGSSNILGGLSGITAVANGNGVSVFATTGDGATQQNTLQLFADTAAFNANLTGAFSLLATAPSGTAFRGVAFGPSVVPEPSSVLLGAAAAAGLAVLAYRRRANAAVSIDQPSV